MTDAAPTPSVDLPSPAPASGVPKAISALTVALGSVVLLGWLLDIDVLERLLPGLVTMKANAAAAFVLSGACLYLHVLRPAHLSLRLGRQLAALAVLLLGVVTLAEHAFGWDAGLDQLLFKEPTGALLTSHPGRMSTIAAANFALIGGALLLLEARRWLAAQATTCLLACSTLVSLAGYMFGNLALIRAGSATAIAAHTVTGFALLAVGLLGATPGHGLMVQLQRHAQPLRFVAALLTLGIIFSATFNNFLQRRTATGWVEDTYEVLLTLEEFSNSIHDFLYHNRGFLITGDRRQLLERDKRGAVMPVELAKARQLLRSEPEQQARLAAIEGLVARCTELASLAVRVRREQGPEAAAALVMNGDGDRLIDEIDVRLDEIGRVELDMLRGRQNLAEVMNSSSMFTLGLLVVASLLLLFWVFRTSQHELAERRSTQEVISALNRSLEARVTERTAQLEISNKDMESFSYSISHDLRAPLRAINGFSRILQEEYAGRLDEEGRRLLTVVGDNANKMGQLIDDILEFSRAGRSDIARAAIDMERLVALVWAEFEPELVGRSVTLDARDLPVALGDSAMIRQVVFNLLANSVKFTQGREAAHIEVGGRAEGGENLYWVKDNGVGFDDKYSAKLFGVFQRLHGMAEFEGTGIGLAIVKRIITKHGGRVWAEGKVGEGATFGFALPSREHGHG